MTDSGFVLSRERRDEIFAALKAIGRQVGNLHLTTTERGGFDRRAYVIGTNLTIIQECVTNLPQANSH